MLIIVGLILLAILLAAGLVAGVVGALSLGGVLASFSRTRPVAPILVCIVPMTMAGALAGGAGVGYLSLQLNESAVVVGAGVGLVLGAIVGFGVGCLAAVRWWRRLASVPSK
jgi:hypothetical protein